MFRHLYQANRNRAKAEIVPKTERNRKLENIHTIPPLAHTLAHTPRQLLAYKKLALTRFYTRFIVLILILFYFTFFPARYFSLLLFVGFGLGGNSKNDAHVAKSRCQITKVEEERKGGAADWV